SVACEPKATLALVLAARVVAACRTAHARGATSKMVRGAEMPAPRGRDLERTGGERDGHRGDVRPLPGRCHDPRIGRRRPLLRPEHVRRVHGESRVPRKAGARGGRDEVWTVCATADGAPVDVVAAPVDE